MMLLKDICTISHKLGLRAITQKVRPTRRGTAIRTYVRIVPSDER